MNNNPPPHGTKTTEWGVRYAPGDILSVRWCPTMDGIRDEVPYTEVEARADSARSGYPVVTRERIVYEDDVTAWKPAD